MRKNKSYIPVKLFLGYFVFAVLLTAVTAMLFSENAIFSDTEKQIASENAKILKVNAFLSMVYQSESLSRVAIQSGLQQDQDRFNQQYQMLHAETDSLKMLLRPNQTQLLDSVQNLLERKKSNIDALRIIKSKSGDQARVTGAIDELTRMEESLRKLRVEDFVRHPSELEDYQLNVLRQYVDYLNEHIPDDETNTLSQKTLDSMLVASRILLNEVRQETLMRNRLLGREEKKLLDNELQISVQLRHILSEIEAELIDSTTRSNQEKAQSLNRIVRFMTGSAIVGFVLALFFSFLVLNDFLKTKRYKEQLEVANHRAERLLQSREQLISTVSHDLKTPLSTIAGYTQLMAGASLSDKQKYYNTNIKGASEYISRLVQDLLDFTQIEAGKITIENVGFSLPDVIVDITNNVKATYPDKPISLFIETDEALKDRIMGDPFRLRQILTNLVQNAFKFTASGTITVRARADISLKKLFIEVEDTGIGIAADKLDLIFEEFTQADASVEKRFGGTGLGLTISRKMAEILGGSLGVQSRLNQGSLFRLTLPLLWDKTVHPSAQNQKLSIAVVDDDAQLLDLTSEFLRQHGHEVMAFSGGKAAFEGLKGRVVDVVFTDVQMPEMDGFAFLERWKQTPEAQIPVIAITGMADADGAMYRDRGFAGLVRKPFTPKALLEELSRVTNTAVQSVVETLQQDDYDRIRAFFPDDADAFYGVLRTFMQRTQSNMQALESAVKAGNITEVNDISHKMRPMFLQLGAAECGRLLLQLQHETSAKEAAETVARLKPQVQTLMSQIRQKLIV